MKENYESEGQDPQYMMNETQRFFASLQPDYNNMSNIQHNVMRDESPPRFEMDVIFNDDEIQG